MIIKIGHCPQILDHEKKEPSKKKCSYRQESEFPTYVLVSVKVALVY